MRLAKIFANGSILISNFRFGRVEPYLNCNLLAILAMLLVACTLAPTPANLPPDRLYVLEVSDLHLNHYEHCLALTGLPDACDFETPPPPGKSHQDLLRDYDTLIFLTTLQGIVNRERPQLYDAFWLQKYREADQPYGWLSETEIVELPSLSAVLELFADQAEGLVLWDPAVPATLNVATTMAGVEDLVVLRAGSEITSEVTGRAVKLRLR
jgi:hypothetical protein